MHCLKSFLNVLYHIFVGYHSFWSGCLWSDATKFQTSVLHPIKSKRCIYRNHVSHTAAVHYSLKYFGISSQFLHCGWQVERHYSAVPGQRHVDTNFVSTSHCTMNISPLHTDSVTFVCTNTKTNAHATLKLSSIHHFNTVLANPCWCWFCYSATDLGVITLLSMRHISFRSVSFAYENNPLRFELPIF